MIKIRIIPCLDVDNGRVVKGINFVNLVDAGDPVKQAKFYSENGDDEITFLDIKKLSIFLLKTTVLMYVKEMN